MTAPTRIGLIGTGRIGRVHAASVNALDSTTLAWVSDPFVDGAYETAARFGDAQTRVSADAADVLASGEVDAVIVASPTATHVDLIGRALEAGVPVLCEKPVDLDLARVDALRERAREARTIIALGFNRRFDPQFAEVRRRVRAGEIGRLEHLAITSRDPQPPGAGYIAVSGGIFRDMTIHDFDTARSFVPDIVSVTARGANQFSGEIAAAHDYDAAAVVLEGANGELITITNSRHSAYGHDQRLEAFGERGMLRVENLAPTSVQRFGADGVEAREPYYDFFLERYADAYRLELQAFVESIGDGVARNPGYEDGRAALVLADAATRSAAEGVTIAVDPAA